MSTETTVDIIFAPVRVIVWIIALPIRLFTWIIAHSRTPYNPEKDICPGCGFRGDDGGNTCRIQTVRTTGTEKAMIAHECLRCSAVFHTPCFRKPEEWMPTIAPQDQAARIKDAIAKRVL